MAGRGLGQLPFGLQFHDAVGGTEAHSGHRIDDDAQARPAGQLVRPASRLAAPQVHDEVAIVGALQFGLDLACQLAGAGGGPLRQQAGMDQAEFALGVAKWLPAQPAQQFGAIRCIENGLEGVVLAAKLGATLGDHQQIQVVVAEHGQRRRAERFDQAQRFQ